MKSGVLIDKVVNSDIYKSNSTEIDGKWYIARPLRFGSKWRLMSLFRRISACGRVLADRGFVVYFKEDE